MGPDIYTWPKRWQVRMPIAVSSINMLFLQCSLAALPSGSTVCAPCSWTWKNFITLRPRECALWLLRQHHVRRYSSCLAHLFNISFLPTPSLSFQMLAFRTQLPSEENACESSSWSPTNNWHEQQTCEGGSLRDDSNVSRHLTAAAWGTLVGTIWMSPVNPLNP